MINKQHHKLIEGQFNSSDALNILFALFNSKMNFHQLESFSNQIKNSGNLDYHQKRILELQKSYISIKEIIDTRIDENIEFNINCNIEITPIKK